MFESKPNYEWDVPTFMREPESTYWRMVSLTWAMPWFVMSVHWEKTQFLQSFLIGSDLDLISALRSMTRRAKLASLACCLPEHRPDGVSWSMLELTEVWMGVEPGDANLRPLCLDREKRAFGGPALDELSAVTLSKLVARVGDTIPAST